MWSGVYWYQINEFGKVVKRKKYLQRKFIYSVIKYIFFSPVGTIRLIKQDSHMLLSHANK